ncbi:SPOR domain-containing protein [Paracoccus aestuariivivens]|uniref:SPOR domain-containing protein n=2 Tax=Paracoccus aestuariivivens TaxID=1820333 RepID=A0A6L6J4S4_9RHOB|nr:SPOR domain-containing protein [Paracoccus aestuariivivens]MTH76235.1 SPOR domain-containing protein [Paracoccus aestuariivivens]
MALAAGLKPAESPPEDFAGRQYIDSKGCVFLREQGNWTVRVARDGSAICGYPPTLSVRGLDGRPRLAALDPDAGKSRSQIVSEHLSRLVLTNLRPGELASDPRPLDTLPDMGPEPAPTAPLDDLKAAIRAAPAVRASMSREIHPNLRLCKLLGHGGKPAGDAARDPTQGFCDGLKPTDLSRLAFARPVSASKAKPVSKIEVASKVAPALPTKVPAKDNPKADAVAKPREPAKKAQSGPTKPRHIQITSFKDSAEGEKLARKIAGLGFPVLRGRLAERGADTKILLTGPFATDDSVNEALQRLRKAGFGNAVPR